MNRSRGSLTFRYGGWSKGNLWELGIEGGGEGLCWAIGKIWLHG